jgi:hypothetical protein
LTEVILSSERDDLGTVLIHPRRDELPAIALPLPDDVRRRRASLKGEGGVRDQYHAKVFRRNGARLPQDTVDGGGGRFVAWTLVECLIR